MDKIYSIDLNIHDVDINHLVADAIQPPKMGVTHSMNNMSIDNVSTTSPVVPGVAQESNELKEGIHIWKNEELQFDFSHNNFNLSNETQLDNIIQFHIKDNIKNFDHTKYYIDYSLIDEHFDFKYENINKITPELCLLFFISDTSNPIIFTNVDNDAYKYKEVSEYDNVIVFIPKKNTHIVVNKSNYYRFIDMYNEKTDQPKYIKIRIWNDKINPNNISNVNPLLGQLIDCPSKGLNNIITTQYSIYKNIIEKLLYESEYTNSIIQEIKELIEKHNETNIFCIYGFEKDKGIDYDKLLENYGKLTDDIYPFVDEHINTVKNTNRFYKNTIFLNTLSQIVCFWIISESIKSCEWKKDIYFNYKNYLNIENIPSVLSFVLFLLNPLLYKIQNQYDFFDGPNINIKDIFICKYTSEDNYDNSYIDNSFLTININLNDISSYTGGEIIFDDSDHKIELNCGDMIVYNGKKNRTNCKIISGEKYVLVILIELVIS